MLGAWGCRQLFWFLFMFPLDVFPEAELLDHMVILFLISEEAHTVFWGGCASFQARERCPRSPLLRIPAGIVISYALDDGWRGVPRSVWAVGARGGQQRSGRTWWYLSLLVPMAIV